MGKGIHRGTGDACPGPQPAACRPQTPVAIPFSAMPCRPHGAGRPQIARRYKPMNAAMAGGTARRMLAQNVRVLRLTRGWSQEALAEAAELDRSYVGDIEQARRNVSLDSLERLAGAFDLTLLDLLREPDPTELGAQLLRRISGDINGP